MAQNIDASLKQLSKVAGFIGAAIVDADSGMTLGTTGGGDAFNVEVAAAANTDVVNAKARAAQAIGLSDSIDDILITLTTQYHLIRPSQANAGVFVYIAVDRAQANLALTRRAVQEVEGKLSI